MRCLWELTADAAAAAPGTLERVLPDGCMEWVFHFGTPFRIQTDSGSLERQSHALLVGVTTRAVLLEPSANARVLGVRFHPWCGWAASPVPARQLTDRIVPLADTGERWFDEVAARLHATRPELRVARLQGELRGRLERAGAPRRSGRGLDRAVRALVEGSVTVDQVARACGLGARQLQRRFLDEVGVGPKHLARIARFARAAELVSWSDQALTAVAHAGGYADQSHFAREFRALAGLTPGQYRAETHDLADAFAGGDAMSHSF